MKFDYSCDMGNVKVGFFKDGVPVGACFFDNGIGDISSYVVVIEKGKKNKKIGSMGKFLGHFTAYAPNSACLFDYDCEDLNNGFGRLYWFPVGRWFVYQHHDGILKFVFVDKDIHA